MLGGRLGVCMLACSRASSFEQQQDTEVWYVVHRILEGMALMLMQADELRVRCLEHLAGVLTPRQYAYVLIAPCDILQLA